MLKITQKGDFHKTESFLKRDRAEIIWNILSQYGAIGCSRLAQATPVDSGKTAASWYYTIEKTGRGYRINWSNSNVNDGVPIAILIQYGHGTRNGGYVPPNDYVNPAMKPILESVADEAWKEVTKYAG